MSHFMWNKVRKFSAKDCGAQAACDDIDHVVKLFSVILICHLWRKFLYRFMIEICFVLLKYLEHDNKYFTAEWGKLCNRENTIQNGIN